MADADDMINVAQRELEQLVGQNTRSIGEAKKAVVSKDGPQAHRARMQYSLVAEAAETSMSMHNLNAFADYDITKDGKKGEDSREGCLAVDDPKRNIVDLESIGQVPDAFAAGVGVCNDDDFVSTVYEFLGW